MKTKIIAVLLLLYSSMMFAQIDQKNDSVSAVAIRSSMTNTLTSSDDRMFHRLGLGDIDDPTAMFSAFQGEPLQKAKGDYITLYSFITNCFYNVAYNRLFLVRDAAGDEWTTARFHEGISIDDSFSKPGETRTWWERDPYDKIQSWGDGAEMPCPKDPLEASTPGVCWIHGCPCKWDPIWRSVRRSSTGKYPLFASAA